MRNFGVLDNSAVRFQSARMPKPVVASYCVTFLAPEMLHVYRQIHGLQQFRPHVITQKWVNRERFPMPEGVVHVTPKAWGRAPRRFWFKQMLDQPVMVSRAQTDAILREIRACGASVLHVYFGHIGVYLLPVLRRKPVPVVVSFHGADAGVDAEKWAYRDASEEMFRLADLILVRSESIGNELMAMGCPGSKIRLSRTGLPLEEWPMVERTAPAEGAWRVFQACRLIEKKGLDVAIKAFAAFQRQYLEAEFRIAGEGPLKGELEALAAAEGARVSFLGFLDQAALAQEIRQAHLFLHPSRTGQDGNQEGVPNSMLEAMATGLAVVATRHGGIPEAVEDGVSGVLVAEDDVKGLAAGMLRLAEEPAFYRQICQGARQAVEDKFSRQAQIAQLEACYHEVMG